MLSLIRGARGGRLNDPNFGSRFSGDGPYAELLGKRFRLACERLGLNRNNWRPDLSLFSPPPQKGDQLSLLWARLTAGRARGASAASRNAAP